MSSLQCKRDSEVSYADFVRLENQVQATSKATSSNTDSVAALRDQDVKA